MNIYQFRAVIVFLIWLKALQRFLLYEFGGVFAAACYLMQPLFIWSHFYSNLCLQPSKDLLANHDSCKVERYNQNRQWCFSLSWNFAWILYRITTMGRFAVSKTPSWICWDPEAWQDAVAFWMIDCSKLSITWRFFSNNKYYFPQHFAFCHVLNRKGINKL